MIAGVEAPVAVELAVAAVVYGWASTRVARWEAWRTVAFLAGLGIRRSIFPLA